MVRAGITGSGIEVSAMPLGPQPRRARGTIEHPYSALRLRQVLAIFGVAIGVIAAVIFWLTGLTVWGWFAVVLAVIGAIDTVVVTARIRRGRNPQPSDFK
jgi:hypothetical protein